MINPLKGDKRQKRKYNSISPDPRNKYQLKLSPAKNTQPYLEICE